METEQVDCEKATLFGVEGCFEATPHREVEADASFYLQSRRADLTL